MWRGIEQVKPGATLGDIGHAIQQHAEQNNYSVVREYCGHGIGQVFHQDPQVLHYGKPGTGMKLEAGMIFTIEPGLYFREDDLLIPPEYRGIGIRVEDDVLMTEDGPEWISAGIPKQIDEVEEWMASMAAEGAKA